MLPMDLLDQLQASPFLRRLPPSHLDRLASAAIEHHLDANATVLREDEPAHSVFLIAGGRVAVTKRLESGEQVAIATRERGDWIGEMALLDEGARSASVVTLEPTVLLEIPHDAFLAAILAVADAARDLLRVLSTRLRDADRRHIEALTQKTDQLERHNRQLARRNRKLASALDSKSGFERFVGESAAARRVVDLARRAAESDLPALLLGPTGTGKEILARAIHANGERAHKELVTLNCALLSETLLESELFGHVRGAFTGATTTKPGLVEIADGGTLFLDEIAELPRGAQSALLRFLELGEYRRLGDTAIRRARVRLLAATHVNLDAAVREGRFRADLLYRIDVVRIEIPALRDRAGDVPLLIAHVIASVAERSGLRPIELSPRAFGALCSYGFPGNVRELENEIERLYAISGSGAHIDLDQLSPKIGVGDPTSAMRYAEAVRAFKVQLIASALRTSGGVRAEAARRLGVHPANLTRMLRDLGLRDESPSRPSLGA